MRVTNVRIKAVYAFSMFCSGSLSCFRSFPIETAFRISPIMTRPWTPLVGKQLNQLPVLVALTSYLRLDSEHWNEFRKMSLVNLWANKNSKMDRFMRIDGETREIVELATKFNFTLNEIHSKKLLKSNISVSPIIVWRHDEQLMMERLAVGCSGFISVSLRQHDNLGFL